MPKILKTISDVRDFTSLYNLVNRRIGFVPTMGALHEGHLELGRKAMTECDCVIYSIYVNPSQFGPGEDLDRYPRTLKQDIEKLDSIGADAVFLPGDSVMYPEGYGTFVEVGDVGNVLCGKTRPGHFRGVATIVTKLFNIVGCDQAYFGKKDMQQLIILRKTARELNMNVEIIGVDTVREKDGLAMSSRNSYLGPEERKAAPVIRKALLYASENLSEFGSAAELESRIVNIISEESSAAIEYIEVRNRNGLEKADAVIPGVSVCFAAVRFGNTRLIDNIEL